MVIACCVTVLPLSNSVVGLYCGFPVPEVVAAAGVPKPPNVEVEVPNAVGAAGWPNGVGVCPKTVLVGAGAPNPPNVEVGAAAGCCPKGVPKEGVAAA